MKRHKQTYPLPAVVGNLPGIAGLVSEGDIRLTPRARLLVKVLIFKDGPSMRSSWYNAHLGNRHDKGTCALHSNMKCLRTSDGATRFDPRYVSLVAFSLDYLDSSTILHEAIHCGFAYCRRTTKKWAGQERCMEEAITYPTEGVYRGIQRIVYQAGLTTNDDYTQ